MSGFRTPVVAVHTPWSFFSIGSRWPMPVTATSLAFGARSRNVTLPSGETSGDLTGGANPPRPAAGGPGEGAGAGAVGEVWANAADRAAFRMKTAILNFKVSPWSDVREIR